MKLNSRLFLIGTIDTIPLMVATAPFAVAFGALAQTNGLSVAATLGMSAIVFAGASQFVAVALLGISASIPIIILTVFIINLRHILYSTSLMPHVSKLPQGLRAIIAFWVTDEIFAATSNRLLRGYSEDIEKEISELNSGEKKSWSFPPLYFGVAIPFYLSWIFFTWVGIFMGQEVPKLTEWGLDIAMVVAFVGIVVPLLKNKAQWACAITAFFAAIITQSWPHQSGLLLSSLLAILVGVFLSQKNKNTEAEDNKQSSKKESINE